MSVTEETLNGVAIRPFSHTEFEGDALWILGGLYTWKARAKQTGGAYSLCEVQGSAGFSIPRHIHDGEDEAFFVGTGQATLLVKEEEIVLRHGGFAFVPRGTVHTFRLDEEATKIFLLITPGGVGHEAMFAEMGQPATERVIPPPPSDVDPEKLGSLAARHGTRIVGPPLLSPAG
jgi:quercetin dioxygenase-like cupin family protein